MVKSEFSMGGEKGIKFRKINRKYISSFKIDHDHKNEINEIECTINS